MLVVRAQHAPLPKELSAAALDLASKLISIPDVDLDTSMREVRQALID